MSHLLSFWGHFGAAWGYFGPVLGLNLKLLQTSHVTTQEEQNSDGGGFGSKFEDAQVISGPFGTICGYFGANFDYFWA